MSTVMTTDAPNEPSAAPHHRRSREEVEALAKNFVATPVEGAEPPKSRALLMAGVAGAAVLAAVVAFFALRSGSEEARQESAAASRAAAEVEELRQRMEAERERTRKELQTGQEYLERIAAADASLVRDLAASADRLADREAAAATAAPAPAPVSTAGVPTPRDEPRTTAARTATTVAPTTTTARTPATPTPTPQQQATPQQQEAAVTKAEPAKVQPVETETVAQADKSHCQIHVSELSASGKLTYESIKKVKGVRVDEFTGHVFTPPVMTGTGRKVEFEVLPDGCVRVARR